jgi:hypothetical protein
MKTYSGVDVQIHIFLTSALVGGEWSASRDSSVGIATGWTTRGSGSSSPGRVTNFHFSVSSRRALGSTQPPIKWVPGSLSGGKAYNAQYLREFPNFVRPKRYQLSLITVPAPLPLLNPALSIYRQANCWTAGVRFPAGARDFFLLCSVQNCFEAHPASYSIPKAFPLG